MSKPPVLLNCDLGESFGALVIDDAAIMPFIDMANIACGFHSGSPLQMQQTLGLARQTSVTIGAHPSYPDLVNFGRRSMDMTHDELVAMVTYQVAALEGMANAQDLSITYVKPHGALYHDVSNKQAVREAVLTALARYPADLSLVVLASDDTATLKKQADRYSVKLMFEGFADRHYHDSGQLVSRQSAQAILEKAAIKQRINHFIKHGEILSINGHPLRFPIDTLCVHGDTPDAVNIVKSIRQLLDA